MWPTRRLPASVMATIEGVVLYPPRLGMTVGTPSSTRATHEFVVPRSMPMTRSIQMVLLLAVSSSRARGRARLGSGAPKEAHLGTRAPKEARLGTKARGEPGGWGRL